MEIDERRILGQIHKNNFQQNHEKDACWPNESYKIQETYITPGTLERKRFPTTHNYQSLNIKNKKINIKSFKGKRAKNK